MNKYINAIKLLNYLDNLGIKWENIGTTPDNKRDNLLSKYQLTKPYVDGVNDAMNKRGQYEKINVFLEGLRQDWIDLGKKRKQELLNEFQLDIDIAYVDGIADAIKKEKSKHADSGRVSEEQL